MNRIRSWAARAAGVLFSIGLALTLSVGSDASARAPRVTETRTSSIELHELPPQAREVLERIRAGGPFRYRKDGTVFGNRERLLPRRERGYYTEYTVRTPGVRHRGARRIIAGGNPRTTSELYYTDDHYRSFRRIRLPR
ncbi:MAG: ribonuclease N [Burkholderiaceae bacterium]|nr:ribonuclease N [Burkholderiaceae bacterium]